MEENKKIKVKLSTIVIIILLIIVCVLGLLFFRMNNDYKTLQEEYGNFLSNQTEDESDIVENVSKSETNSSDEPNLDTILDKIYIAQKFIMASDEYKKELFASCGNTTAKLNDDGKLEVAVDNEKFIVEEVDEEIIDIKLGIVNQHDGKDDINTSFVRDVFVLTKFGDVYAVNITYGYRPDLISKILEDVVKLENVQRKGMYDDSALGDSVVVAKKVDNTIAICDDGERDGF